MVYQGQDLEQTELGRPVDYLIVDCTLFLEFICEQ
jgi:hypothetical protein